VDAEREATEAAARAMAEEKRLTVEQAAAFERLKNAEAAVNAIELRSLELERRRAEAEARFDRRTALLRRIVPIALRLSASPGETLIAAQLPPEDAIRSIALLRFVARQANDDARALAGDRDALDAATREAAEMAPRLAAAEAARSYEADALARQLAAAREQRWSAEQDASDAARRAAGEAARAQTLRSMLEILETQRRLEEARAREDALRAERDRETTAAEAAHLRQAATGRPAWAGTLAGNARPSGQLTTPVAGVLVRGWGDAEDGEPASGLTFQTELGARAVAPCGGTVAFAEPFRGYGLLVIIDCGGGYHTVLSGLDRLAVTPGRSIRQGDPVGAMRAPAKPEQAGSGTSWPALPGPRHPGPEQAGPTARGTGVLSADASGDAAAPGANPVLYFELRKGGHPVNPAPWLKAPD
jgi:septal ring factor EnvC (AmiA/AmiB activator)